jgi:hypothetical protein
MSKIIGDFDSLVQILAYLERKREELLNASDFATTMKPRWFIHLSDTCKDLKEDVMRAGRNIGLSSEQIEAKIKQAQLKL